MEKFQKKVERKMLKVSHTFDGFLGTHLSLKQKGGLYAQLVKAQEFKEKTQTVKNLEEDEREFKRRRSLSGSGYLNIVF